MLMQESDNIELRISQLVTYVQEKGWIRETDRNWAANRVLEALDLHGFEGLVETDEIPPIHEILDGLCKIACKQGILEGDSAAYCDLFDTKLMGLFAPRPSEVIETFQTKYKDSPKEATDWYYTFSQDTNYIRRDRIRKDRKWTVDTEYGTMDITINLSKPEKDPRAIAAAGKMKASGYPKCLLCAENEGYAGHLNHPARQNHRLIPITLNGKSYYMQYSPYVYYNEHCIVLNKEHTPMHIDRGTFENLLEFVTVFPHYFIGSNADLPIVGGSVLSHDHYQGGNYEFAMARAKVEESFELKDFEDISCGIVKWPMSVIRLNGNDRMRIAEAAEHILNCWRNYTDADAFIFCETDGVLHSTITPIARRRGKAYELDLVLRNNITTEEHPLGVFHPHAEKHHIKKENIGLIEVMGLAVLPARLKEELQVLRDAMLQKKDLTADPRTASHAVWAEDINKKYPGLWRENMQKLQEDMLTEILHKEVGQVFCSVLEDAGVFKRTPEGRTAFRRFLYALNQE